MPRSIDTLPKDIEKAAEPIMDRANKVKEQVTSATADLKQNVEAKAQAIREKSGKSGEWWCANRFKNA